MGSCPGWNWDCFLSSPDEDSPGKLCCKAELEYSTARAAPVTLDTYRHGMGFPRIHAGHGYGGFRNHKHDVETRFGKLMERSKQRALKFQSRIEADKDTITEQS